MTQMNEKHPHYPYQVVAVGNPHSEAGVRWHVQYPGNGRLSICNFAGPKMAEALAQGLKDLDDEVEAGGDLLGTSRNKYNGIGCRSGKEE